MLVPHWSIGYWSLSGQYNTGLSLVNTLCTSFLLVNFVQVEMAYYNSKYALWEPVIEPIGKRILTFPALTDRRNSFKLLDDLLASSDIRCKEMPRLM